MERVKNFAILRSVPEDLTWDQFDASAIENLLNLKLMGDPENILWTALIPDVTWVRTYWEPGATWGTCLYTAPSEATVREWHDICHVAYAGIREVEVEEAADQPEDYPRGFHAEGDAPLVAIETVAHCPREAPEGLRWIRTYRDPGSGRELRLFLPADASVAAGEVGVTVRRVVEVRPGDYE